MSKEHILIVEDAKLIRDLLQLRFEAEGYRVSVAVKVTEALEATHVDVPDLLILDLGLDDDDPFSSLTDGFAFLGMLRRNHPKADVAVIVYTVNLSPVVLERAKAMGVAAVIQKKGSITKLVDAVHDALAARKQRQSEPATTGEAEASPQNNSVPSGTVS